MATAIFQSKVYPSFAEAAAVLKENLTRAYEQLGPNALDFGGLSFLKTNAGDYYDPSQIDTESATLAAAGITDEEAASKYMAAIIVKNITGPDADMTGSDGKSYKIPQIVALQASPKAVNVLNDTSAQAKKFVGYAVRTALFNNMKAQFRAMASKGVDLPTDMSAFLVTPEQGSPDKAFDHMFKTLQTVLVGSAAADPRVAAQVNTKTVTKDALRAAFESQAAADALFPSISAEHWDKLLTRAAQVAPTFTKEAIVKGADGKALKEMSEDGKERAVRETVAFPQRADIFLHWLESRHETQSEVETPQLASLDFGGMASNSSEPLPTTAPQTETQGAEQEAATA